MENRSFLLLTSSIQTSSAFAFTHQSEVLLVNELFENEYKFILTSKIILTVGLRKVINSPMVSGMVLIKIDINFWKDCLTADRDIVEDKNQNLFDALVLVWIKRAIKSWYAV